MIRRITKFGENVLHNPADTVAEITGDLGDLVRDMVETMYAAPGIGLAAPQVGVPLRVFVVDLSVGRTSGRLMTFINPEFVEREGMQIEDEGCLSLPGFNAAVARPARAVVKGIDLDGKEQIVEGAELLARAFQHEMDHLDGRVFLHRLKPLRRMLIERRITRLRRRGRW